MTAPVTFLGIQPAPAPMAPVALFNLTAQLFCQSCGGTGRVELCWPTGRQVCMNCHGAGALPKGSTVTESTVKRFGYGLPYDARTAAAAALEGVAK